MTKAQGMLGASDLLYELLRIERGRMKSLAEVCRVDNITVNNDC